MLSEDFCLRRGALSWNFSVQSILSASELEAHGVNQCRLLVQFKLIKQFIRIITSQLPNKILLDSTQNINP